MAIKVGGTTVIDDSRALNNISSVDAATVTALSNAGIAGGGTHDFVASGAISSGEVVSLQSDGTVTLCTATGASGPNSVGSNVTYLRSTFDSNSNKVIVSYKDNSVDRLKVTVGTISGGSISFGTPVIVENANIFDPVITFDSNSNKVVVAFSSTSGGQGRSYVGTVSGSSISFGSMAVFNAGSAVELDLAFDTTSNKVVVVFRNGNSNIGEYCVGTVSGTSISWGSVGNLTSSTAEDPKIVYNSTENKLVAFYKSTSNLGQSRVGTLSGTTISWGSVVQYSDGSAYYQRATSIGGTSKVAVIYRETSSGDPVSIKVGEISGTAISSFGSKVVVDDASGSGTQNYHQDIAYDETSQRILIGYRSTVSKPTYPCVQLASISGTSISLEGTIYDIETQSVNTNNGVQYFNWAYDSNNENYILSYTDNNGTSSPATSNTFSIGNGSNFIGVASESISDTATGEVTILGGVNESLTGLTVSADYYVSATVAGAVSTSTGSNIKIGRALSATKLLITQGNTQ